MNTRKNKTPSARDQRHMLCENLSFSTAEAYKLLRTNLLYSIPNKEDGRVIGITSSTRGEGKTTTAINLAYTLAETGAKVLLIDGDMRLPSIAKRLARDGKIGLSGLLVGLYDEKKAIQESGILPSLSILSSGTLPPNPAELLGTERMREAVADLRKKFDYLVIDLPPVNIVSDALIVSGVVDGMVVVVRQDYSDRRSLNDCINSLKLVNAHILGFVMADAQEEGGGYGRYKYRYGKRYGKYGRYRKYGYEYNQYGYRDGYGYAVTGAKNEETKDEASEQEEVTSAAK